MNLGGLVVRNALRNPRRTVLTIVSIAVSMALIVILETFLAEMYNPSNLREDLPRVVAQHRTSITLGLPGNYLGKIAAVPGVVAVSPLSWFQGIYKDPNDYSNWFPRFATDPDTFFKVFTDYAPTKPEHLEKFRTTRTGLLMGEKLFERLSVRDGLEIGSKISFQGDIYPVDLEFEIVGTFSGTDSSWCIFQHKYLDEARGGDPTIGTIWMLCESVDAIPPVSDAVEAMFRNSSHEVKAMTEKSFYMSFMEMMGNVKYLMRALISVIVFAIVLIAASTMAMAIRERTRELAVMRSVGYRRPQILALVVAEGLFVSFLGGLIGVLGSWLLIPKPGWFMTVFSGVFLGGIVGIGFLLLSIVLPEAGSQPGRSGLAHSLQRLSSRWGARIAVVIGLLTALSTFGASGGDDWNKFTGGMIQFMNVRENTVGLGLLLTLIIGLCSSVLPAWNASRRSVIDGLRSLE